MLQAKSFSWLLVQTIWASCFARYNNAQPLMLTD